MRPPQSSLPPTFRFIREEDARLPFRSGEGLGTLRDLVALSHWPGHVGIVKEVDGRVLGAALIILKGKVLIIDRIARDLDRGYKGIGGELIEVIENDLAPAHGVDEVRLEALNESLVKLYEGFGFVRDGPRIMDEEWGWLYPMSKKLGH